MKNPFAPTTTREERKFQQDLQRWRQMAAATGNEVDKALLRSQPPEVLRLVGPRVEHAFSAKAKDSGELYPIEEKDHSGRDVTRYYGDIKAAYEPFTLPSIPIQLSKVVWHDNTPYIASQLPASVQMARAMAEIGRPER